MSKQQQMKNNALIKEIKAIRLPVFSKKVVPSELKGALFFVSIDLIDSTAYKVRHQDRWATILMRYFDTSIQAMTMTSVNFWKIVGDEILFYRQIKKRDNLPQMIYEIYDATRSIEKKLLDEVFKGECGKESKLLIEKVLIKTTVFMAEIIDEKNASVIINGEQDFFGVDIDEGFRLAKYAGYNRMAIDPKLMYILRKRYASEPSEGSNKIKYELKTDGGEYDRRFKLVGFEELKGVWNGHAYPIIWYAKSWKMDDIFLYSEISKGLPYGLKQGEAGINGEIASQYAASRGDVVEPTEDFLSKLLEQANQLEKCNKLLTSTNDDTALLPPKSDRIEMHVSVICLRKNNNQEWEVFLFERPHKDSLPKGIWEFGCVRCDTQRKIEETAQLGYKDKHKIEIGKLLRNVDAGPAGSFYRIIGTYPVVRDDRIFKGIYCVAEIKYKKTSKGWVSLKEATEKLAKNLALEVSDDDFRGEKKSIVEEQIKKLPAALECAVKALNAYNAESREL